MSKKQRSSKSDETPEFQQFWEAWKPFARDTDGRGAARDAFIDHVKSGADPQDIVDGARFFLRTMKDKQFVPLVQTWLNRRAFEDMAEQERSYQERIAKRAAPTLAKPANVNEAPRAYPPNHFMSKWSAS